MVGGGYVATCSNKSVSLKDEEVEDPVAAFLHAVTAH